MKGILSVCVVLLIMGAATLAVGWYLVFFPNAPAGLPEGGVFYLGAGSCPVEQLIDSLDDKRFIKNRKSLALVARWKRYDKVVHGGRYRLRPGMSNNDIVNLFRSGNQEPVRFTFHSVRTVEDLARLVDNQLMISATDFLGATRDSQLLAELGFTPATLPALFLPDTYELFWDIPAPDLLRRFKREYDRFWSGERMEKLATIGLTPIEAATLASIVEEETAKPEEFPVIAGVYLNRLKRGWPLDADPTLKYVAGDFTLSRLLNKHKKIDSPYNTYLYTGLPPGPIRIASVPVINGVLNRQVHDYLFFCAKSDFSGYHVFSRTLRQHDAYAREYQRELNRRRIMK